MSLRQQRVRYLFTLVMVVVVGLISTKIAFAQSQTDESAAPTTGAITGRVINENGQPVSHATIYITAPIALPQPRTTTTDEGGNFQVAGLDALVYSVGATAPAYITASR